MYGTLLLLALSGSAMAATPSAIVAPRPPIVAIDTLAELHQKMSRALEQRRAEDALGYVKAMIAHPDFAGSPEDGRRATYYLAALLNAELQRFDAAAPYFVQATEWPGATREQWFQRVQAHARARDQDAASAALITMLGRFPGVLDQANDQFVVQLANSRAVDKDIAFNLRDALFQANWDYDHASWTWVALIDDLIARGRGAEAGPVFARVTSPGARLQLFALRRYDAIRPADAVLNIEAAYAMELAADRKAGEKPDAVFKDVSAYAGSLLLQGRYDEVLSLVDAALQRPAPEADSEAASDLTWIMDTRARALMSLGRHDEALEQMRTAAARTESGSANVSQTINLGWLNLRLGRDRDAMTAISGVSKDGVSPFGWMQAMQVRACAAHAVGDAAEADAAFAHLAEHWKDAPGAAYEALACRGDEEGMVALMIERFNDPETAEGAVSAMHDYLPPSNPTDFDGRLNVLNARVLARPEVIAARDAVGRPYVVPTVGSLF